MCHLDDIVFIPAKISPMKIDRVPMASAKDRLEMVKLAIGDEFSLSKIELEREGVSYSIDTVRDFLERTQEEVAYHLILGEDSVEHFFHWKEAPSLLELAPPIIVMRKGFSCDRQSEMTFLEVEPVAISSTDIRNGLLLGGYDEVSLPAKVLDYIRSNRLYSPPNE